MAPIAIVEKNTLFDFIRINLKAIPVVAIMLLPACFQPTTISADRSIQHWRNTLLPSNSMGEKNSRMVTLNLEQAVQAAIRNNPSLREDRSRIDVARAKVDEDTQLKNPEFRVRDIRINKLAEGEPVMNLGLRVPIPQPWIRNARLRRAEISIEEAQAQNKDLELRIRGRVYKLYATLLMLEKDAEQVEQIIQLCDKSNDLVKQSVKNGNTTNLDASVSFIKYAELVDERHQIRLRQEKAIQELRKLVGIPPDHQVLFQPHQKLLALPPINMDEEHLIKQALIQRADIKEADARSALAEADAYISRAQRWPWFRFAEVSYNVKTNLDPLNFEFAMALELPLLSWNRGAIATQEARLAQRRIERQTSILAVTQEVHEAVTRVRETALRIREMKESLLPTLEAGRSAIDQAITHGAVDPLRTIDIQWRSSRANRKYLKALLDHREALIDLETAVGGAVSSDNTLH